MNNSTIARRAAEQVMAAYIIDISYLPFDISNQAGRKKSAVAKLLWFRIGRPLLVLLAWLALGTYAYRCFLKLEILHVSLLVILCQIGLGIFLILLVLQGGLLVFNRVQERRLVPPLVEDPDYIVEFRKSLMITAQNSLSITELAAYAELDQQLLTSWQAVRSLVAFHDEHGQLRSAQIRT